MDRSNEQQRLMKEIESLENLINTHKHGRNEYKSTRVHGSHSYHGSHMPRNLSLQRQGGHVKSNSGDYSNIIVRQCSNVRWRSCESLDSVAKTNHKPGMVRTAYSKTNVQSHKPPVVDTLLHAKRLNSGAPVASNVRLTKVQTLPVASTSSATEMSKKYELLSTPSTSSGSKISNAKSSSASVGATTAQLISVSKSSQPGRSIIPPVPITKSSHAVKPVVTQADQAAKLLHSCKPDPTQAKKPSSISKAQTLPVTQLVKSQDSVVVPAVKGTLLLADKARKSGSADSTLQVLPATKPVVVVAKKTVERLECNKKNETKGTQRLRESTQSKSVSSGIQQKSKSSNKAAILVAQLAIIEKDLNDAKLKQSAIVRTVSEDTSKLKTANFKVMKQSTSGPKESSSGPATFDVASSASNVPNSTHDSSKTLAQKPVVNTTVSKTEVPSSSSQPSNYVKSVACVSPFSYVKFAEKFKWFAKGGSAGASAVDAEPANVRCRSFNPAQRRSFEGALSRSIVPLLLAKIEDEQVDESDENGKKVLMQRIQLLENEVENARLAKSRSRSPRWKSPRRRQAFLRSKLSPQVKKSFHQQRQLGNFTASPASNSESNPLIISPPRPKPNRRFVLNRLNSVHVNVQNSKHKLVRNNSKNYHFSTASTSNLATKSGNIIREQGPRTSYFSRRSSSSTQKDSVAAAALIRNKYKLVRQKSTPQYNITRYTVVRKDSVEGQLGTSGYVDNNARSPARSVTNSSQHGLTATVQNYRATSNPRLKQRQNVFGGFRRHHGRNKGAYVSQWDMNHSLATTKRNGRRRRPANARLEGTNVMWDTGFSLRRDHSDGMSVNQLLGRQVANKSKSRYKFVKGRPSEKISTGGQGQQKYKVDHRSESDRLKSEKPRTRNFRRRSAMPSASRYRVSAKGRAHRAVVSVGGVKYRVDAQGRTLRRVSSWEAKGHPSRRSQGTYQTYSRPQPSMPNRTWSATKISASQSLTRSIAIAVAAHKKSTKTADRQYCLFYNRFGKCNRGNKCPFVHDPDKIAVCTRFLRGTCKVTDCPFSHKVARDRMPVCSHFLRGVCTRENCPYPHVNVGKDAEVCLDFVRGFCALGEKCKKKHTLICQEWVKTGTCSKNKKCGMNHPKRGRKRLISGSKTSNSEKIKVTSPEDDTQPLWKRKRLPSFIPLESSGLDDTLVIENDDEPLKILPNLSLAEEK